MVSRCGVGIRYETRDQIAYITIDNIDRANVLDHETSNELAEAWRQVWEDRDVGWGSSPERATGTSALATTSARART